MTLVVHNSVIRMYEVETLTRLSLGALLLAAASLTLPAFSQTPAPAKTTGCGDPAIHFDVESDRGLHPSPIAPGRALVFFIEDDEDVAGFRKPTTRVGIDGKWVGATHGSTYFFFYVDPGQHRLCTDWQDASVFSRKAQPTSSLDFTASAGSTYYFRVTNTFRGAAKTGMSLAPVKTDNPEDLLGDYLFAFFHQNP
jgi:hypothetical protein